MVLRIQKALVAAFGLCLAVSPGISLLAQQDNAAPPPPPPHGRHFGGPDRLGEKLGLTPEQAAQVKSIREQTRKQEFELHKQEPTQIRALLNDEQKAKWDAMQARMKDRMAEGGKRHAPPPPPPPAQQ